MRSPTGSHVFSGRDLNWLVDRQAALRPDKDFLIWEPFSGERRRWTYLEFATATKAYAAGLAAQGVEAGTYVAILLDNCPEFLIAWYACARLGAISVPINTSSSVDELAYFLRHSEAAAAITSPKYLGRVQAADVPLRLIACVADEGPDEPADSADGCIPFSTLDGDAGASPGVAADAARFLTVMYTSGTTSRPKGVVWTHANALWSGSINASHARLTDQDVHPVYFPLFHANALAYSVLATLSSGGTVVLMPKFSASRFWDVVERHQCTWASQIPFTLRAMERQPVPDRHNFRFWACPGGDLGAVEHHWKVKTVGWYGMTETVSQCTVSDHENAGPEGAIGHAVPEYELVIRRDDGSEAIGETGNLWIRGIPGLSLFHGYLHDEAATAASFDDSGWFDTGDEVRRAASGELFFIGRSKDMLKVGAENVAALEIETVIAAVAGVVECAVVGRPDPMLDEVPVAFVVSDEAGPLLEKAILTACETSLSSFKRPRAVHFVAELPKGVLGKILKKELRTLL